jgi:hypothetical protein
MLRGDVAHQTSETGSVLRTMRGETSMDQNNADKADRLACKAFLAVFQRRQTGHGALLSWLQKALVAARISDASERELLEAAARKY